MISWPRLLKYDLKSIIEKVIKQKQEKNPRFSQRAMAKYLGMSPSTLNEIIKGKRNLSKKTIDKMKRLFADDPDLLEVLEAHERGNLNFFTGESNQYTKTITTWHHEAILELTQTVDFNDDPQWIAERLNLPVCRVTEAIDDLFTVGALTRHQSGKMVPTSLNSLTAMEKPNEHLLKRAESHLEKIATSIKELPYDERFFGTVTIAICPDDFEVIRTRMVEFIKEQTAFLSRNAANQREVHLISLGCVPLTRRAKNKI